tara:strand:+ start:49 stop:801 length:753 start_codon:yes stop_codon:yes gene_type:complete
MLRKRIIPTLLLENKKLVKTVKFKERKYIGDPLNAVKIFNEKFVDELIILDIKKNKSNNEIDYEFLKDLFSECFVPVTYGGGISSLNEADKIFKLGIEKICLNSMILEDKQILKSFVKKFGSQSIVASVDVKKNFFNKYKIFNNKLNKFEKKLDLIDYLKELENFGVGEIIINSIDQDGIMKGMDLNLIKLSNKIVNLPIVYVGGIGSILDIQKAFEYEISGVSAGSFFVFYGPHKAVLISYPHNEFEKL